LIELAQMGALVDCHLPLLCNGRGKVFDSTELCFSVGFQDQILIVFAIHCFGSSYDRGQRFHGNKSLMLNTITFLAIIS